MSERTLVGSFAGKPGPRYTRGLAPSKLGWGPDDRVHPERSVVNEPDGAEMVWVPAGTFGMGSQTAEIADILSGEEPGLERTSTWLGHDERPYHRARISRGYWLYKHPVTRGQCRSLVGRCPADRMGWRRSLGHTPPASEPNWSNEGGDGHPVMWATWRYASDYARRAGVALPTEAQWEYAARGRQYLRYPWGSEWDASRCQSAADKHGFEWSAPVGRFPDGASWCGALDLAGNTWEWCEDWYAPYSYESVSDPVADPRGADDRSGRRVMRGGSWWTGRLYLRCAARLKVAPGNAKCDFGFRCAAE